MDEPLSTEQVRALAGHASIGEPIPILSLAEAAGWSVIDRLDDETRAKLLQRIDDGNG